MRDWLQKLLAQAAGGPPLEQITLHGIPVELVNSRADIRAEAVLERLDEALALIATYQPWRLRHLQRDVRAIRVERFACFFFYVTENS